VLSCYDLNGNPIAGFGNAGIAVINQNNIPVSATTTMAVDSDGDIYLCSGTTDPDNSDNQFFLTSQVVGAINNVSIGEYFRENELLVYPNPTSGLIHFEEFSGLTGLVKAEVLNSLGQIVFTKNDFTMHDVIDLNNEAQGIYFIQITYGSYMQSVKVIKQ
jgi:hypothetical protein